MAQIPDETQDPMVRRPLILRYGERRPAISETAFVAPTAAIVGDVTVGPGAGVFYGAVLRGDRSPLRLGANSNLQDNATVHSDPDHPTVIGERVSVGHGAVIHGCTIEDDVLVGMNATVLNGAVVGRGSLIAAGAVVLEGAVIPPGSLVAGVPGKVRRELTVDEQHTVSRNAQNYIVLSREHRALNS